MAKVSKDKTDISPQTNRDKQRIAKYMSRAGLCSRREAERWIEAGRVSVNGKILESPAFTVSDSDRVLVDNKPVRKKEPTRLFMYHKPAGLVTTQKDERGRKTVFNALPEDMPRVISVGRLDMNTEGLLLLTNNGELSRHLELPSTGWKRRYRVRAYGDITQDRLNRLEKGLTHEGVKYGGIEATLSKVQGNNIWMEMAIREGKNREIRRICEALGLQVSRLIRLSYGPFQLGSLEKGNIREVSAKVIKEQIKGFKD